MKKIDVSIIIVNYNTKRLLSDCINSIIDQTKDISYEIIVVDNDSHDGSQQEIRDKYPNVRLIESGGNLGFGKANNIGMREAKGDFFFLLNSDTILLNNAIEIFYEYACKNKNSVLGSILLDQDLEPCHSYGEFITPVGEIRNSISKYLRFLKNEELFSPSFVESPKNIDYITGADIWLSKEIFEQIGGFDPDYFMYCEEVDWQYRMSKKGIHRTIIPGPKIVHLEGGSDANRSKFWSSNRLKNIFISKRLYYHKNFNKQTLPLFRLVYLSFKIPELLIIALLKGKERKKYLELIKYI